MLSRTSAFKNSRFILRNDDSSHGLKRFFCARSVASNSTNNQHQLTNLSQKLNITSPDDWYSITTTSINEAGGEAILNQYKSLYSMLSTLYPEHDWLPWKFETCHRGYWSDISQQRKYLDWVSQQLGLKNHEDWYKVTSKDIQNLRGGTLLNNYNGSRSAMLSTVYPEHNWLPWKFERANVGLWNDVKNQRKFLDWVSPQLNVKDLGDWYKVGEKEIQAVGGRGVLGQYKSSLYKMLSTVYPEYNWLPWKFSRTMSGFWKVKENQRNFMEWAAKELKLNDIKDWYKVSHKEISKLGGIMLLKEYDYSLPMLLSNVFPDHSWDIFEFDRLPSDTWDTILQNTNSKKDYVEYLAKALNIKTVSDWYNITAEHLKQVKTPSIRLHELMTIVKEFYPELNLNKFSNVSFKKSQSLIKSMLNSLFQGEEVLEDYKHPDIIGSSGKFMELDYFLPNFSLAIEYQGRQHFHKTLHFHQKSTLEEGTKIDQTKASLCKSKGITLVQIPYWWDKKYDSFAATIYLNRPDLFKDAPLGNPIPSQAPADTRKYRDSKEERTRKSIMAATVWDNSMDPTGWWMSEKFDGVRVFWDGRKLHTRQGRELHVPESWSSQLPQIALDGELWTKYGLHQEATHLCTTADDSKWNKATFWVFDVPEIKKPFEERMEVLKEMEERNGLPEFVKLVKMVKCEGPNHLAKFFTQVINNKGEGVMLREPNSMYQGGRSNSMRKYKEFFDTEVKIEETHYPHGFACSQLSGKKVFVNITENMEEAQKLQPGAIITVKHSGTNTYGTLLFPKFYRKRTDVTWDDLLKAFSQ